MRGTKASPAPGSDRNNAPSGWSATSSAIRLSNTSIWARSVASIATRLCAIKTQASCTAWSCVAGVACWMAAMRSAFFSSLRQLYS
jgi:hypothetical protein